VSPASVRVPALAAALAAPLVLAALLTSGAAPAAGAAEAAPPAGPAPAPGYQVLVTSGPGGPHPVTVPAAGHAPAAPAVTLRLGGRKIVVPLGVAGHGRFAVTTLSHASQRGRATAHGSPLHTLTVAGTNLAGQPDTGDQVLVGNVANAEVPGTGFGAFQNGTAAFSVPAGTYWAVAVFVQHSGSNPASVRLDVLPQFTVAHSTTVHAGAAAATSKVTMATPRPAVAQSVALTLVRAAPHAPPSIDSPKVSSFIQEAGPNVSLWVNPVSRRPSYGTLRVFTSAQLTSPPGQAIPYAYTLNFASPAGTIAAQHFTVGRSSLATVSERYLQDVNSVGGWQTEGGTPYQLNTSVIESLDLPQRLPARQVQYISAGPAMLWRTSYSEYRTVAAGQAPGGQTSAARLLHAGQRLTRTWGALPLHPAPNVVFPHTGALLVRSSATRAGNELSLDVTPFSDNQLGHTGAGLIDEFPGKINDVSGSYALYQNGTKIAGGDAVRATGGFGDVQVSAALAARPSLIKFVLSASRASAHYHLSATSRDVWTWHSRPEPGATIPAPWVCNFASGAPATDRRCAVQPMMTFRYHVAGLGPDGATTPARQAITLTAGHIQLAPRTPVTRASVHVSFDGGKTWTQAQVRPLGGGRFGVTFTAPASAQVSLRSTARDSAGNGLTETILDGYKTAA
jgi:hypothetical protein